MRVISCLLVLIAACAMDKSVHAPSSGVPGDVSPGDLQGIRRIIREEPELHELEILSARYAPTSVSPDVPDGAVLELTSTRCDGQATTIATFSRTHLGWHFLWAGPALAGSIIRGDTSCAEARTILQTLRELRDRHDFPTIHDVAPTDSPYAVGKAYNFISVEELGSKDEDLLAAVYAKAGRTYVVLLKRGHLVDVRTQYFSH